MANKSFLIVQWIKEVITYGIKVLHTGIMWACARAQLYWWPVEGKTTCHDGAELLFAPMVKEPCLCSKTRAGCASLPGCASPSPTT